MLKNISPYLEKKILITLSMGFVSGVPLLLTITLLQAWLTDEGVTKSTIGLFALVGLPYSLKFLWAPLFDYFTISRLGRRRGWLLLTQVLLIISIIALGMGNPSMNAWNVALLATLVAISSASQDIVIDAYRRESLTDEEQTIGASAYVLGYRIGALAAGAGGLILADHMSYQMVYALMSIVMLYGIFITLIADEPKRYYQPSGFISAVYNPFVEFFNRYVSINIASDRLINLKTRTKIARRQILGNVLLVPVLILVFILLYKIGDTMAHSLSTNFYLDIGFTKTEIGAVVKFFGLIATLIGAFLGGLISLRIGLYKSLIIFGVFQALATLGFSVLAFVGNNIYLLMTIVSLENLAAGMGYTAYLAFIANMTSKKFTATQFALMTALMSLPRTLFSSYSGFLVEMLDWELYFIFCSLIAFPALIILVKLRRRINI
ncbi:MAG: MFS transporter [Gammaproteobacteria bacterium]|mgnify:FL=1|nr:MFS transporter [Gammaproteobacteria bacterium]MBT4462287.1 MFS transporter [Gammaproteobacteria bacterium]MBT4655214.1 MFS transporter [Gammaproteobacteria bacterium]MBT5116997.1 MFS transporter [Gammaproteobacteria bacterium]MBT5762031.1 MFS transporter [Gammaproteobacteria bacterium]